MWRAAAAAVAVVAVGTLVVSKARSPETESYHTVAATATSPVPGYSPPAVLLGKPSEAAGQSPLQSSGKNSERSSSSNLRVAATRGRVESTTRAPASVSLNGTVKVADAGGVAGVVVAGATQATTSPQPSPIALDAASAQAPLRVVGSPSVFGEKRTLYEVAPGDTVMLAESDNVRLDSVATSRVGTAAAPQAQAKMSASASTMQRAAPLSSGFAGNGLNTIVWTDVASGKVMRLSGRHSRAELQDIRRRIERMQAGSSGKLKTP
jgi:hypothetical protein